jgi:hypothetical protein
MSISAATFLERVTTDLGNPIKRESNANIFYNAGGVSKGSGGSSGDGTADDIYIDCKPLSDTNDNPVYVKNDKTKSDMIGSDGSFLGFKNFKEFKESPYFIVAIVAVSLVGVVLLGYVVRNAIKNGLTMDSVKDKMSNMASKMKPSSSSASAST